MALACQKDSYLKELTTKVISIQPATIPGLTKKEKIAGHEVTLEDTVLFPEGGGQPDDRGTISGVAVTRVRRAGTEAVHFIPGAATTTPTSEPCPPPFFIGDTVHVLVDWTRRFDHMTQHSGQHLVTAVADQTFGFATTSWNLGDAVSSIELATPSVTAEQLQQLEVSVNQKIRDALPVYPTLFPDKIALEESLKTEQGFRQAARGLPDDHKGPVRIVTITDTENNMCCGTHVANTSHLQAIKLLGTEKGKKGSTNLLFVAGGRVLTYLGKAVENERALTGLLKGGPEIHADLVDKLQKNFKSTQKSIMNLLRNAATEEVERVLKAPPPGGLLSFHSKEGDNEYMNIIANGLEGVNVVVFLTVGDDKKEGNFVLSFPPNADKDTSSKLAKEVMTLLEAKGFGKKNQKWQGKVSKMSARAKAEILITDWTNTHLISLSQSSDSLVPHHSDHKEVPTTTVPQYPDLTLYTYPNNPNAFKGLVCATYSAISVRLVTSPEFQFGVTNKSQEFLAKFPKGKVPALEISGSKSHLNESNAIASYLSSDKLRGANHEQQARNHEWVEFSTHQLVPALSVWVYPVLGVMELDEEAREKAKKDLRRSLGVVDAHLLHRTFLVAEHVCVSDVVLACDLLLGFELVFDAAFLRSFVNLRRWFVTVVKQEAFQTVVGKAKMVDS